MIAQGFGGFFGSMLAGYFTSQNNPSILFLILSILSLIVIIEVFFVEED
jgi:hypothetical protein